MSRVQVLKREYPGKIIRDLSEKDTPDIPSIALDSKELSKQLDLPEELIKAYCDAKIAHTGSSNEALGGLGLHSEELSSFAIMGFLIMKMKAPFQKAAEVMEQVKRILFQSFHPDLRVVVIVVKRNKRGSKKRTIIQVGEIPSTLKCEMKDQKHVEHMTVIDARMLRDEMDKALWSTPLKLPTVQQCVVPY